MNTNIKDSISYSEGGILSKVIAKQDAGQITLFSMAAGTQISEHTSTKAGYVYVIEGKGTFTLGEETVEMRAGELISIPKNTPHALHADKDTSFLLVLD